MRVRGSTDRRRDDLKAKERECDEASAPTGMASTESAVLCVLAQGESAWVGSRVVLGLSGV